MLRSFGKSLVVVLACAASGCSTSCCYECIDNNVTGCHDHLEAKFAWHQSRRCFSEVEYISDFRDGFIDGYVHVMNGGGLCKPTLPPRKYWSLTTRGADNNCRIVAWYNGWSSGVAQAQRNGMGSGSMTTAADIYHTNHAHPVELPEDLRRRTGDEEALDLELEMLPDGEEFVPGEGADPALENAPLPAPYNPPAKPMTGAQSPIEKLDGRVFLRDSLTPPAPPRADGLGN